MTARQMQIAFQDAFERADLDLTITSTELFKELNDAQDLIVAQLFQDFEMNNQISAALAPLVVRNASITTTYPSAQALDGFTIDRAALPGAFRFFIAARARVEYKYGGYSGVTLDGGLNRTVDDVSKSTLTVPVRISQQDDIYRLLQDPFNKSLFRNPVAVIYDTYLDVYADDSTFATPTVFLDYLKDPDEISLTGPTPCELPDHLHRQIVDTAVERYLQRTTTVLSTANKATE
jgi:hypothetical protein